MVSKYKCAKCGSPLPVLHIHCVADCYTEMCMATGEEVADVGTARTEWRCPSCGVMLGYVEGDGTPSTNCDVLQEIKSSVEDETGEVVGSCWGYYMDPEELMNEAVASAEHTLGQKKEVVHGQ